MADTKVYTGLTAIVRALPPDAPDNKAQPARWSKVTLRDLSDVEELLDYLENAGYEERDFNIVGEKFVVRWR